jgi:hypothetical protein
VCECVCAWRRCDCSCERQVVDSRLDAIAQREEPLCCSNNVSFACGSMEAVHRFRCDDSRIVLMDGI